MTDPCATHDAQVLHGNLKPSNCLLLRGGAVLKLADYGPLNRLLDLAPPRLRHFATVAPEILRREGHGRPADVWSLGSISLSLPPCLPPCRSLSLPPSLSPFLPPSLSLSRRPSLPPPSLSPSLPHAPIPAPSCGAGAASLLAAGRQCLDGVAAVPGRGGAAGAWCWR